jgi:hypothetical protein
MEIILFYYILTVFIGLILIFIMAPEPIILIRKNKKNKNNNDNICLLEDNKCINL